MASRGRKRPLSNILRDKLATMSLEDPKYFDVVKWIWKIQAQEIAATKERRKSREGKKSKISKASKTSGVVGKMNPGAARYLEEQEKKNGENK